MFKYRAVAYQLSNSNHVEYALVQSGTWRNMGSVWIRMGNEWTRTGPNSTWVHISKDQLSIEGIRDRFMTPHIKVAQMAKSTLKSLRKYGWMLNDPLAYIKDGTRVIVQMPV